MDLSALIFVALAVAWGFYLIPKALKHVEDVDRTASIERFSASLRVLARREPVADEKGRLVVRPGASSSEVKVVVPTGASRTHLKARREAAARAAKRRMRVFALLLVANLVVGGLAVYQVVAWPYVLIPVGLTLAWLVACRLMVKAERRTVVVTSRIPVDVTEQIDDTDEKGGPLTEEIVTVTVGVSSDEEFVPEESIESEVTHESGQEPGGWDPVPHTLPTYVSKDPAPRRTVRTIDLESTGVWTSGNTESASKLARQGEAVERSEKAEQAKRDNAQRRRASGS